MGSKNRIFLGYIPSNIIHHIRNIFEKNVYMTIATAKKIEKKHSPLDKEFIYNHNFQIILDNTISIYSYHNNRGELNYNCLTKVDERFFIYGLISKGKGKGKRTEVSTLFIAKTSQIKNKFFKNENTIELKKEEFTTN